VVFAKCTSRAIGSVALAILVAATAYNDPTPYNPGFSELKVTSAKSWN